MNGICIKNAATYAARFDLRLAERLGFGIHGIVYVAENKTRIAKSAIKAHIALSPYLRERDVYKRLREEGITEIRGFHVPQLIRTCDDLMVIEMSIVTRPFILDFAGAYLDMRPKFSDEIWADWEEKKREQFENRWPIVQAVIDEFEVLGIYLVDITPTNLAFAH